MQFRDRSLGRLDRLLEIRDLPSSSLGVLDRHVRTGALFLCCGKNYPTHFESYIHPLLGLALLDPRTFDGAHVVDEMIMAEKSGRPAS